ncbi:ASCH domain-containing protein [Crocosphaera sp. Alani8]|uniref:ASCH domain-containing protein n=1 Tax=Crocosphaera sp. Alani8 TaxID=3038952 RepID=UPI00313EB623
MTKLLKDKASVKNSKQESQDTIAQIKAISLHPPYASLIKMGLKHFETRSWPTNYRGKLVICAAKKNTNQQQSSYSALASELGIDLTLHPWGSLPLGEAIAVCDLVDCIEMTEDFINEQSETEQRCGHWEPGCFAWKLNNVQPLPLPVPIKGKQGLWNIDPDEVEQWLQGSDDGDVIVSEVIQFEELTNDEQQERLRLERIVEKSFVVAGQALRQLKDLKLYRDRYKTFEEYAHNRFGFSRRRPYFLIDAAAVVDNLEKCDPLDHKNWKLPTNERQVRPLIRLEPSKQVEVWTEALKQCGGKVPSGRVVKEVVQNMQQPKKIPIPWRVGEVAQIIIKGNPDLKGKGGCWAVIKAVNDFSCSVQLWDGQYEVKPENLKDLPYSNEQQKEIKDLSDRISNIKLVDIEQPARDFLAGLGKINRPWLTDIEESLVEVLERKMKQ